MPTCSKVALDISTPVDGSPITLIADTSFHRRVLLEQLRSVRAGDEGKTGSSLGRDRRHYAKVNAGATCPFGSKDGYNLNKSTDSGLARDCEEVTSGPRKAGAAQGTVRGPRSRG